MVMQNKALVCHNLPGSKERGREEYFKNTEFNSPNT